MCGQSSTILKSHNLRSHFSIFCPIGWLQRTNWCIFDLRVSPQAKITISCTVSRQQHQRFSFEQHFPLFTLTASCVSCRYWIEWEEKKKEKGAAAWWYLMAKKGLSLISFFRQTHLTAAEIMTFWLGEKIGFRKGTSKWFCLVCRIQFEVLMLFTQ